LLVTATFEHFQAFPSAFIQQAVLLTLSISNMPRIGAWCVVLFAVAIASFSTAFKPLPTTTNALRLTRLSATQRQVKAAMPVADAGPGFAYLSNLDEQTERMSKQENEFMLSFWSPA
jgi:hypothetical protein